DFEMKRFTKNNRIFLQSKLGAYRVMAFVTANIYMIMRFVTLIVLVVGAWLSYNDQLLYGELVAFVLFVNVLSKPIEKISALLVIDPKEMPVLRRLLNMLAISVDIKNKKRVKQVKDLKGDLAFNQLPFTYEVTQKPVLNDLSFQHDPA